MVRFGCFLRPGYSQADTCRDVLPENVVIYSLRMSRETWSNGWAIALISAFSNTSLKIMRRTSVVKVDIPTILIELLLSVFQTSRLCKRESRKEASQIERKLEAATLRKSTRSNFPPRGFRLLFSIGIDVTICVSCSGDQCLSLPGCLDTQNTSGM